MILPLRQIFDNALTHLNSLTRIETSSDCYWARQQTMADIRRLQLYVLCLEAEVQKLRELLGIQRMRICCTTLSGHSPHRQKSVLVDL